MSLRYILLLISLSGTSIVSAQIDFKSALKKHRTEYKQAFLQEERAPLDTLGVQNIRFFRPKKAYQVSATFTPLEKVEPFDMLTYSGEVQPYIAYGKLQFILKGESLELTLYRSLNLMRMPMYRDYLFLPFKDATNQKSTYGGGRYLDFKTSDIQDGQLILDFNKAYNPYCAYSDGYSCPVPPYENHLLVKIKAGEKAYSKPGGQN